jgi:hypothetical protein
LVVGTLLGPEGTGRAFAAVVVVGVGVVLVRGRLDLVPLFALLPCGGGVCRLAGWCGVVAGCWLRTAQWTRASSDSVESFL